MTRILVIRHGETDYNLDDKFQGWVDSDLTQRGLSQAETLTERLKGTDIDIIYSSPLKRALKTAEIVRRDRPIPIVTENKFKEIKCGRWEGLTFTDVKDRYGDEYDKWHKTPHLHVIPDGETFEEVYMRAKSGIERIIKDHKGQTVLISTHNITTLLIMAYFGKESIEQLWSTPKQGNTALNIVEIGDMGEVSILLRGDDSHLERS